LNWDINRLVFSDIRIPGSWTLNSRIYSSYPRSQTFGFGLGVRPVALLVLRPPHLQWIIPLAFVVVVLQIVNNTSWGFWTFTHTHTHTHTHTRLILVPFSMFFSPEDCKDVRESRATSWKESKSMSCCLEKKMLRIAAQTGIPLLDPWVNEKLTFIISRNYNLKIACQANNLIIFIEDKILMFFEKFKAQRTQVSSPEWHIACNDRYCFGF
jgi:hypothetical protein